MRTPKDMLDKIDEVIKAYDLPNSEAVRYGIPMNQGYLYGIPQPTKQQSTQDDWLSNMAKVIANKVSKVDVIALKDYIERLKNYDIDLPKTLRELSALFGTEATLHEIAAAVVDACLPTKTVGGQVYIAGYKGTNIVKVGEQLATLIGLSNVRLGTKLLFAVGNRYIYSVPGSIDLADIFETVNRPNYYTIVVKHEKIENTGDIHAVVADWFPAGGHPAKK